MAMTAAGVISSVLGTESFADYEQSVYKKYQETAEREIIGLLNAVLVSMPLLQVLKAWAAKSACRFHGLRAINIRLKSGETWQVWSPIFLKAKPKGKRGRAPRRQKGAVRHLGLELLGIIRQVSPALIEVCVSMAVLCPSFEVAANALRGLGVEINQHFLQNVVQRFANLAMAVRSECHTEATWQQPGQKILICVDGGRIRERRNKRGRRNSKQKRQGFHADWIEPRQLTISQFGENGQKIKSISPILDGSCGSMDDFFGLLKEHLMLINLEEASEIVFCADGGPGIWPRIDKLISELGLTRAKRVLDYTHAKQNMQTVTSLISSALKLSKTQTANLCEQIRNLLWDGNINGIAELTREKLAGKKKAVKAASKKLDEYFGDHSRFQYRNFRDNGLPTGSGTVESAIRRVINLRIKGTGMFWKRENAEKIIFLRSLVLTGKLKMACHKALSVTRNMFDNIREEDLPMAA
jgi:hypothetical protein